MLGADPGEGLILREGQVAEGIQAGSDAQGVRRQVALPEIVTADGEYSVVIRRHVEAAVVQGVKVPEASSIPRLGHTLCDAIHDRLNAQGKVDAEQLGGDRKPLVFGDQVAGDGGGVSHGDLQVAI